ncbi:MAG: hypothetical protein C5B51_24610 [Terriglobia bacterium]|nr:MAG: hypothetical protein C5B51_24610 [Terriglobia bacterium]
MRTQTRSKQVAPRQPLFLKLTFGLAAAVVVLALSSNWWLAGIGWALVRDDGPVKADIAVVLGGDYKGSRILRAGELVRQGYVPAALISGPAGFYGQHECDLAIAFAERHGYPGDWFIPFPDNALSTRDEAAMILPVLHQRNVHRMLLVTSDYHSARAARIFRKTDRTLGGTIEIRMITSPDEHFRPGSWWRSRQGQKIAFDEWTKTVAAAIGL